MSKLDLLGSGSPARALSPSYFGAALTVAIALFVLMITISPPFMNTDDLFYGAWAGYFGKTGHMWAPDLARQFPDRTEILIYPPLHMATAGLVFRFAGFTARNADLYTALCAFLTSLGCILTATRLGLERAALAVAPAGFVVLSFSGLRPEVTSDPLFAIGFALLLGTSRAETFLGRVLLFLAPTAGPTALGPAAAVLGVFTLYDLLVERDLRPILDSAVAFLIAVLLLGLPIDFHYSKLIADTAFHYAAQESDVSVPAVLKACLLLAGSFAVWKRDKRNLPAALALLALGMGLLLGMSHTHAGTSVLITFLSLAIFVSAMLAHTGWEKIGAIAVLVAGLLMFSHLLLFWTSTKADPIADARARQTVEALRAEGRTVLVDDIAGKYLYDFDVDDKISWHWAMPFPISRPESLADLRKDDVWVVSRFGLLGYLRGESSFVKYLNLGKAPYEQAPLLPCLMGRMSCRLPLRRFDYVLFWRDKSGQAYVQDLRADTQPRPIS